MDAKDPGNMADANPEAYPNTIRNVQRRFPRPAFVIPGHQSWASTQSLEHTLELLRKARQANGK